ncbi:MAG: FIG00455835: hypothetical protein [uncultured Paraburkholderia sp.]|nr:MAG: FIG00455835: hypothetical protein [uncultured Paraburkholderia sp.]CAH2935395.1 MAG: FIG00455835: hypothetical protein [uncultured Paraburkholderia sp.]
MADSIYLRGPDGGEPVAVATGFSWGAFLLGFVWVAAKRMWFTSAVMLAINLALMFVGLLGESGDLIGLVLSVLFALVCGLYGNEWHRKTLERRGYTLV